MGTPEATGRVIISAIPSGEAPEEIRKAWMGLTLPCYPFSTQSELLMGVETRDVRRERKQIVTVPQADAIAILEKERPEAAKWWKDRGFPLIVTPNFSFGLAEVTIISGVVPQKIIEVTDEMQGDSNR